MFRILTALQNKVCSWLFKHDKYSTAGLQLKITSRQLHSLRMHAVLPYCCVSSHSVLYWWSRRAYGERDLAVQLSL